MYYEVCQKLDRRGWKNFFHLADIIYEGDRNWIAPIENEVRRTLDAKRNPYFADAILQPFLCYRGGHIAARTVVVINRAHEKKFATKTAFFGFFECSDDPEAARSLFSSVENYCKAFNVHVLEGPFNPNHYSELGLQVDAFDKPPSFFQTYNPPYYSKLLESVGFRKSAVLLTSRNENVKEYVRERYGPEHKAETPNGYSVRHFDMRHRNDELEILRDVFNDAFSENWHYLSVSQDEYQFSAQFVRLITEPELVTIVEHERKPVGVLMCVLDINPLLRELHGKVGPIKYLRFIRDKKKIKSLIVYAVGIRKSYQHGVVYRLLLDEMVRIAARFETLETTWMSPSNILAVKAAERMGMIPDKHFAIYEKHLTEL